MNRLNPVKLGLTLGILLALVHLLWSVVVALGFGERFIYFVQWAHMIHTAIIVVPFDPLASISVIAWSFVGGCIMGGLFAFVWNKLNRF